MQDFSFLSSTSAILAGSSELQSSQPLVPLAGVPSSYSSATTQRLIAAHAAVRLHGVVERSRPKIIPRFHMSGSLKNAFALSAAMAASPLSEILNSLPVLIMLIYLISLS